MEIRGWNIAILVAIGSIWLAGSTQREKRIVGDAHSGRLAELEAETAHRPESADQVGGLAQAYLDARAPGMAVACIERASASVRTEPTLDHLYARALLEQGRSADALMAERRVLASCAAKRLSNSDDESEASPGAQRFSAPFCSSYLIASATRRAEILDQLVTLGIEDATAHPEASRLAYHKATREVRFTSAR